MYLSNFLIIYFISFFLYTENHSNGVNSFPKNEEFNNKIEFYDNIIKKNENAHYAYFNRGIYYLRLKAWTEAKLDFKKYISLTNINIEKAMNNIAICAYNLKEYDEALKVWDEILTLYPYKSEYFINKINTLIKINKIDDALHLLNEKINKGGDYNLFLLRAKIFEANKDLKSELADINSYLKYKNADNSILYRRAIILFSLKNYEAAKNDLNVLTGKNFADSYYKLSIVEYHLNNFEASIAALEYHLSKNPNDLEALKFSSTLYVLLKQNEKALNIINKIIELDETSWEMFFKRALIYIENKNPNEALKDLNIYIAAKPNDALARLKRAKIFETLGKNDQAVFDILKAFENSKNISHLKELAEYCFNKEKYEDSIRILTKILQINSNDPEIFFLRGLSFYHKGENEAAIYDFSETLKRKLNHEGALYNRAGIYLLQKQYQNAKDDYDILVESFKTSADYFLKKSICEYYLKEFDLSRKSYQKASEIDTALPEYEYYFSDFNRFN